MILLAADLIECVAKRRGRIDDQCLQRVHGLRSDFDCRVASDLEMPDYLDSHAVRLGFGDSLPGQH